LYLLDGLVICGGAGHTDEEAVLVLDQEDEHVLRESVFLRCHVVLWVRKQSRLEDGGQVRCSHLVQIRFAGKHRKQVQDIQQQLAVKWREFCNQRLEDPNSSIRLEVAYRRALCIHRTNGLRLVVLQGIAEALVKFQRNNRFGKLVEISSQNVGRVVHGISSPVEPFAVPIGRVESDLKFLDALLATGKTEDTLDIGSYFRSGCAWTRNVYVVVTYPSL
jgi:hypothetical protein